MPFSSVSGVPSVKVEDVRGDSWGQCHEELGLAWPPSLPYVCVWGGGG
jgi:hypothetical protein